MAGDRQAPGVRRADARVGTTQAVEPSNGHPCSGPMRPLIVPIRGPLSGPKPSPPNTAPGTIMRNRVPDGGCHVPVTPAPATG